MSQPSWRLKVTRAEKHLSDLQDLITEYINGHPYRAEVVRPSNRYPARWRADLDVTRDPDPSLSVILGDFLFDMRSALDHIAVALSPPNRKGNAGFPILDKDPAMETDPGKRDALARKTRDMPIEAIAIIEWEQPYNFSKRGVTPNTPESIDVLHALSAMENADKHRNLVLLTTSLTFPCVTIWRTGAASRNITPTTAICVDAGAELINWRRVTPHIPHAEVNVNVMGTAHVTAQIGNHNGYEISGDAGTGAGIVLRVKRILDALEPLVV